MVARLPVSRTFLNSYPLLVVIFGILAFVQLSSHVYVLAQDSKLDSNFNSIFPNVTEGGHNSSVPYNPDSDDESLPLKAPSKFSGSTDPTFLFPSTNPVSECNLWAPLCQPGSIVVDVLTANRTTKTTVPCSSYLSAQYTSYLEGDPDFYSSYTSSFFRSPDCTSYANWIINDGLGSVLPYPNCMDSMSVGPGQDRVVELGQYLPGGASRRYGKQFCCGPCAILIDEIQLLYFPEKDSPAPECGQKPLGTVTAKPNITSNAFRRRDMAGEKEVIAIINGYTFTSPSFYLQIVGTARVINDCGQVGSIYTNPIVSVAAGDLSTISLNLPPGATFHDTDRDQIEAFTKPVKVADLDCPSWGIKNSPGPDRTVGPPFNPIILPPTQLITLDPAWLDCTSYPSIAWVGSYGVCKSLRNEIFDPPRRLTPAAALAPPTTMAVAATPIAQLPYPNNNNNKNAATPAKTGDPALPASTERPDPKLPPYSEPKETESEAEPGTGQDRSDHQLPYPNNNNNKNAATPAKTGDPALPASTERPDPKLPPYSEPKETESEAEPGTGQDPSGQDPQANPEQASSNQQHSGSKLSPPGGVGTAPNSNEASQANLASEPTPALNLGEIIYNAFGRNNNNDNKPIKPSPPPPPPIITTSFFQTIPFSLATSFPKIIVIPNPGGSAGGGDQTATVLNPSSLALSGITISIGGGPLTILSHSSTATAAAAKEGENAKVIILSLAPENKLLVGTIFLASQEPQPLPTPRPAPPPAMEEVLFRAGEYLVTIVKNTDILGGGSGGYIIIKDQTLTPGGTGGFVSTATAVDNNNNDPIRVDMSFNDNNNNNNNNNKLIIGHETFTIPLSLLPPTPTPTSAPTRITKSITLPNGYVLPLDIISSTKNNDGGGGVMVIINNNNNIKQTLLSGGSSIILSSPSLLSSPSGGSSSKNIISAHLDKLENLVVVYTPSSGGDSAIPATISIPAAKLVLAPAPTAATAPTAGSGGSGGSGNVEVFKGGQDKFKLSRRLIMMVGFFWSSVVVVFL